MCYSVRKKKQISDLFQIGKQMGVSENLNLSVIAQKKYTFYIKLGI